MLDPSAIPILDAGAWAGALAVLAAAWLPGSLALVPLKFESWIDAALLRLALGLALLPVLVLLAGQFEGLLFIRPMWIGLSLAGVILGAGEALRARMRGAGVPSLPPPSSSDVIPTLVGGLILAGALSYFLGPLSSPPLNYDALEYHLGVVPHFFEVRGIHPIPHVFYSAQPIATEMLYTLASVAEGSPWGGSSGFLQWFLVVLAALLLWRVSEAAGLPRPVALLMPFAFIMHPIILRLEIDRMTDLTGAIFLLSGWLLWLRRPAEAASGARLPVFALLGILAGGAVSSKWTNAGTAAVALAGAAASGVWLESRAPRRPIPPLAMPCAVFGGGAALVLLPWLAWVGVETGNPLAPFGAAWFPTGRWNGEQLAFLLQTHGPLSPIQWEYWWRLGRRLLTPAIGSWPVLFVPVLVLTARLVDRRFPPRESGAGDGGRRRAWNVLLGGALGVVAAWLLWGRLRHAADRFLAPTVALEFLMLAAAASPLFRRLRGAGLVAAQYGTLGFFFLAISWSPYSPLGGAQLYWSRALGRISAEEFLREGLGATVGLFEAANALSESSRILAVGEARRYYFRRPVTMASAFDRHPMAAWLEGAPDVETLRGRLREAGFTHLLVNEYETARLLDFHPPPVLEADPEFMELRKQRRYGEMIRRYGGYGEFGARPVPEAERAAYTRFLATMKARATFIEHGPEPEPAFWIAPL